MPLRTWCLIGLGLGVTLLNGCSLLHDLQPHRLRRLNRVPPPHLDPEFTRTEAQTPATLVSWQQPRDSNPWAAKH